MHSLNSLAHRIECTSQIYAVRFFFEIETNSRKIDQVRARRQSIELMHYLVVCGPVMQDV